MNRPYIVRMTLLEVFTTTDYVPIVMETEMNAASPVNAVCV